MKHLLILGGGSAAATAAHRALDAGCQVTLANDGLPLGGTCLNVGCVPSKFYIRAAEALRHHGHSRFPGIKAQPATLDFKEVAAACRALVTDLRVTNYEEVLPTLANLRVIDGRASLPGDGPAMVVDGERIEGDAVLIATGCRTSVPPIPGLAETPFLSNETIWDLDELPKRLIVIGGGYIALEAAQFMHRFGCEVTILQRSDHLLSDQPERIGNTLQERFEEEGMRVLTGTRFDSVSHSESEGFVVETSHGPIEAEALFIGAGRVGNSEGLEVETKRGGYIVVDEFGRTSQPNVYAAGDVCGDAQFVYAAAYEAEVALDHWLGRETPVREYAALPWVVFTDPQVAGVGLSEDAAREAGFDCDVAELPVARWPRFRVACEDRGFLKLIRDLKTDQLLGARIICPEAGDLVGELSLAIRHEIPVAELARTLHPYLTLAEGIERAAGRFPAL